MIDKGLHTAQILVVSLDDEVSQLFNYSFGVTG